MKCGKCGKRGFTARTGLGAHERIVHEGFRPNAKWLAARKLGAPKRKTGTAQKKLPSPVKNTLSMHMAGKRLILKLNSHEFNIDIDMPAEVMNQQFGEIFGLLMARAFTNQ